MFHTGFGEDRSRSLNFRIILIFNFFIVTSNFSNLMHPRSFLWKEEITKQHAPSKKELCEIGEEAISESRFTCFFTFLKKKNSTTPSPSLGKFSSVTWNLTAKIYPKFVIFQNFEKKIQNRQKKLKQIIWIRKN